MSDPNILMTLVSSLGFPIVMCGAMGYFVKYTYDKQRDEVTNLLNKHYEQISEITDSHKNEMSQVTEAVNNNTLAITKLCERMEKENESN